MFYIQLTSQVLHTILQIYSGYLLLGLFPAKPKDHQVMYDAVLRHLDGRGMFTGFDVEDAAVTDECKTRTLKLAIHNLLEDSKGVPHPICCKVCPASNGMCPLCKVKGMKVFNRPCYLGAATRLYERYALMQYCIIICCTKQL
jgi:hypothetical protein